MGFPVTPEEWELETDEHTLAIQKDGPWAKQALQNLGLVPQPEFPAAGQALC